MGIPSYYKRLIDRFPKLVRRGFDALPRSDVLLMDFNCLIYQCVRGAGVYKAEEKDAWEAALLEAVKAYTVKVWGAAGRPAQVHIAVDGVVPMAKIRQQRLRRFKAPWWAAAEREAGVRAAETWDTNAITPGTEFMEKLGAALRGLCAARGAGWTVSDAGEPGEGEQKLMAWIRDHAAGMPGKVVVVYGLDADLIVLSLLALARTAPQAGSWCLLRELAEFERDGRAGVFGALDVKELLRILVPAGGGAAGASQLSPADYMLEYTCAMSFLGNDFLPHSLTVKMRDEGHDKMRTALQQLHATGARLVSPGGRVQNRAAAAFIAAWEEALAAAIEHKYKMRQPPPRTDAERAMVRVQNLPFEWREEAAIATGIGSAEGVVLTADWRETYYRRWLRGAAAGAAGAPVRIYMEGLQWILDYYLGRPVSYAWQFPWNLPPLWADLRRGLEEGAEEGAAPPPTTPVAPQEQLAMVLPMSSWALVRRADLRALPAKAPAFWPTRFDFFSAGKRWMWECEAEVPVLSVERLRGLLATS
jgi:5'-3' exonuclease